MKAIITADVIRSLNIPPDTMNAGLREVLREFGKERSDWEIYRGDEFQLRFSDVASALSKVLMMKAFFISKGFDARFAIGIGTVDFEAPSVKESSGQAYIFSGKTLDGLKENRTQSIMITTENQDFDETFNLIFRYLENLSQRWSARAASFIYQQLQHPEENQTRLASRMAVTQGALSRGLKRAGFDVLQDTILFFEKKTAILQ